MRTRSLITERSISAALEAAKNGVVNTEARDKAFAVDVAQNVNNPAKLAEIITKHNSALLNSVDTFNSLHVKTLNRVIRAYGSEMPTDQKVRLVSGFVSALSASQVATTVNNLEAKRAAAAKERAGKK